MDRTNSNIGLLLSKVCQSFESTLKTPNVQMTERWLRNCDTDGNVPTLSQDAGVKRGLEEKIWLEIFKVVIGTREFV